LGQAMGRNKLTRLLFGLLLVPLVVLVVVQPAMAIPYGGCAYGASATKDCPGSDTSVTVSQPPTGQGFFDKLDKFERIIFGGLAALAASQFFIIFLRGNQKKKEDEQAKPSSP